MSVTSWRCLRRIPTTSIPLQAGQEQITRPEAVERVAVLDRAHTVMV